jgi:hypothetical protein
MKKKWIKNLLMLGIVATMAMSTYTPTFAFVDSSQTTKESVLEESFTGTEIETEASEETETATEKESTEKKSTKKKSLTEEETETTSENAFSIEGSGTVLDQIVDSSGKEFYTIQTANNNTYFLIIDHSSNTQNVYMLSTIDENDLKEFLEESQTEESEQTFPSFVLEETKETESEMTVVSTVEETKTSEKSSSNVGTFLLLGLLGGAVVGGYYYLKIYKPRKDGNFFEKEDLEYLDDGVTINEDEKE